MTKTPARSCPWTGASDVNPEPLRLVRPENDHELTGHDESRLDLPGQEKSLIAYLAEGWEPHIRPAPSTRQWMSGTAESYAYRCLPLNIANSHGWEILNRAKFRVDWDGGDNIDALVITPHSDAEVGVPVSIFGYGVITFHIYCIVRTPPGWNIWVSGSPNYPIDGAVPLSGVIETDWSPYSFTMNWKLTRPGSMEFEVGMPIAFFFPVQRNYLSGFKAEFRPMSEDPYIEEHFHRFNKSRDDFQEDIKKREKSENIPPTERWQKRYYRGLDMDDGRQITDHQTNLKLNPFRDKNSLVPQKDLEGMGQENHKTKLRVPKAENQIQSPLYFLGAQVLDNSKLKISETELEKLLSNYLMGLEGNVFLQQAIEMGIQEEQAQGILKELAGNPLAKLGSSMAAKLRRREWSLRAQMDHQKRHGHLSKIDRRHNLDEDDFYHEYFGRHMPVHLIGLVGEWPAVRRWTPDTLASDLGDVEIQIQSKRSKDPLYEERKNAHTDSIGFSDFISDVTNPSIPNDSYMTAYNTSKNREALAPLYPEMEPLPDILNPEYRADSSQMWIGGADTFTPLHHDITSNLLVQIVGRKTVKLVPPGEVWRLENENLVYSDLFDLDEALANDPEGRFEGLTSFDVTLAPGDALYIPVGWWHQVRSLDFSVSTTFVLFKDPCDYDRTFPWK